MYGRLIDQTSLIMSLIKKPTLSFWQIFNMNVGFLGIQYSFGLQQTAINPLFLFLGASEELLPILNIAGPVTGLDRAAYYRSNVR